MAASEWAVECLRPLVKSSMWDYCILWKFGVDPSSFIQWRGCCCCGGNDEFVGVKTENWTDDSLVSQCRDEFSEHPVRTKACEKLCKFPSSLPLYSGIHGEVVLSNQPRWLVGDDGDTDSVEGIGSQVLVPVEGGLVELYSAKKIPANYQIINFIRALLGCFEQEAMAAQQNAGGEPHYKQFLDECLPNLPASILGADFTTKPQLPVPVANFGFYPGLEGSFTSSNVSKDCPMLTLGPAPPSCHTSPEKSSATTCPRKFSSITKRNARCVVGDANEGPKSRKKKDGNYNSKNLLTERKRRQRIKNGIFTLRSLVPNITKMDISSTLGDAYDYIRELQGTEKMYREELKNLTEECEMYKAEQEEAMLNAELKGAEDLPAGERDSSTDDENQAKVGIEVSQLGASDFLVDMISRKRHGGFLQLMQALDYLKLQVIDVNVTTLNGLIRNILKVQATGKEIQPKKLKGSLLELISQDG